MGKRVKAALAAHAAVVDAKRKADLLEQSCASSSALDAASGFQEQQLVSYYERRAVKDAKKAKRLGAVAAVVSFIPGVGLLAGAAINAGAALKQKDLAKSAGKANNAAVGVQIGSINRVEAQISETERRIAEAEAKAGMNTMERLYAGVDPGESKYDEPDRSRVAREDVVSPTSELRFIQDPPPAKGGWKVVDDLLNNLFGWAL